MGSKRILSDKPLRVEMNRRSLLASTLVGGAWAAVPASAARSIVTLAESPVVETTAGKVRGLANNGVHVFRSRPQSRCYVIPGSRANYRDVHRVSLNMIRKLVIVAYVLQLRPGHRSQRKVMDSLIVLPGGPQQ